MPTITSSVTASDWIKGIGLSIAASIIGGASKLAIRKSWVIESLGSYQETSITNTSLSNHHLSDGDDLVFHQSSQNEHVMGPLRDTAEATFSSFGFENSTQVSSTPIVSATGTPATGTRRRSSPIVAYRSTTSAEHKHSNVLRAEDSVRKTLKRDDEFDSSSQTLGGVPLLSNKKHSNHVLAPIKTLRHQARLLRYSGMFGMTVLNPICCVWAMQYASPSILAPFSGLTLVWIVLFSEYIIGERPQYMQIVAAGWIIAGEIIVAIFGDHTNETGSIISVEDIYKEYSSVGCIVFAICLALWMMWNASIMLQSSKESYQSENPNLVRFSWGVAGGSITGLQNFLKDALTVQKISPLPPIFFVFAFFAAASSLGGLLLLTACMKRYDATYSSSMFVGSFVLSASLMAAVRYHTFQHLITVWNFFFYPLGLVVLLIGIYILATLPDEKQDGKVAESSKNSCFDTTVTISLVGGMISDEGEFVR